MLSGGDPMIDFATVALAYSILAILLHLLSSAIVVWRYRSASFQKHPTRVTPVSIVRPVCGLDHFDHLTLRSSFGLDYPDYEIIFCCADERDAAVPLIRALISENPATPARLLFGDDKPTANPKLNNIVKGWKAARSDWIVIADSNVLMPTTYIDDLLRCSGPQTGLVCSPPVGCMPIGFNAELECAFLNGYQARWQIAADAIGFGFAQGKSMLWRRELLDGSGGILALGAEIAEDAAATKIVRSRGLNVRIAAHPFEQPLGPRQAKQIWHRQLRWARLRRASFPMYYVPEVLTGSALPIAAGMFAAASINADPLTAFIFIATVWYGAEIVVTRAAGWHISRTSLIAWGLRDMLLPILWIQGWTGNTFTWRGNDMSVRKPVTVETLMRAQA